MEQSRIHQQYQHNAMEPGNVEFQPPSQVYMLDPTSSINPNVIPPDPNISEVKPVLNYSITGEEFSLEFMRDRVNPRKPFIPNISGDPGYATGYMELKGILGISHTGSESGSDISMLTIVERGQKEYERRNSSLHEERGNYGSIQSAPNDSNRGSIHGYTSSEASDSSATKMKVLCSFGGKILPRPSDGKLRYVGGETRIIRIRKDISWQILRQKALEVYNQVHVIKYQLPGEDLDALVSVSCDEDLQNMMEEYNELGDREGSQRIRMFLFSMSDLAEAQSCLSSMDGDSEIQFVVAVNGMDSGSRNSLNLHGLRSSSANDLEELGGHNIERETSRVVVDSARVSTPPLTGNIAPSSTIHSSRVIIPSSSNAHETYPQFHHDQRLHRRETREYPLHHACDPSNYSPYGEIPYSMPLHEHSNQPGGLSGGYQYSVLQVQNPQMTVKQGMALPDGSIQPDSDTEKVSPLDKPVPSWPYDDKVMKHFAVEEAAVSVGIPRVDIPPLFPPKSEGKHQEPGKVSPPADTLNAASKFSNDDLCSMSSGALGPGHRDSEINPIDSSYLEPPVPPQRIYRSEKIPREQLDLLNRLSKSDDSLGSQFIMSQSHSDVVQPDPVSEPNEKVQKEDQTFENELTQLQKHKEFADAISQTNSKPSVDVQEPRQGIPDALANNETNDPVDYNKKPLVDDGLPSESSINDVYQGISSVGVSTQQRVDISVDIDDRFPRDFLSDIYSKALISEDSSGIITLHKDGAGISVNMENHEPKRWSYFRNLAQVDFGQKDVSLIDQEHLGLSSGVREVREEDGRLYHFTPLTDDGAPKGRVDSQLNFGQDSQKTFGVDPSVSESMQFDAMMENLRTTESDYEEGNAGNRNIGLPSLNPSLVDFDVSSVQVIKNEDLEEQKELGSGTFGTVYHGKWRGTDVAIKRIKKSCFTGRSSEQERLTVEFWKEAEILSKLHHPNVVAFYGVVQDGPGGTLATVAEYMVDGSLRHVLVRKDRFLDRRRRLIIAMDAAFGMEYLHSKNIVHFDLKCDNLLVNLKDPSRPICKVGDFGLSKIKRNTLVSGGVRGTLPWMAPELLSGSSSKVSEKVDVFSFGIVLWEILTGEEPYANMHYGAIIGFS
ncbi:protein kinase domain-containing protein [Citrus sinensis]|uniref:Protein kinase domain-containing protein n=1 Tax=Citrus sinensis TaxID=2711 RepID=A0ACB8HQG7_CITSI|nr:protein kinase domain-containing protein [Citrus sinensis]